MTAQADPDLGSQVSTRLLAVLAGSDLRAHARAYGPVPQVPRGGLAGLVEAAGLRGRGGAAFPTHTKLRAVAGRGRPVVVANGAEGEPASMKDRVLLSHAPHLVLDGVQVVAAGLGAREAYLYLPPQPAVVERVRAAVAGRGREPASVELVVAPDTFVAGQETAVVAALEGRPAMPRLAIPPVYERGVGGRPTLVQNVETLAHIALVARYGASWFRSVGAPDQPGTMLCSVGGGVASPGVVEVATGTLVRDVLDLAGGPTEPVGAVLVGGYHGAWLPAPQALGLGLANDELRPYGASVGAGVVAALPASRCGLVETARVAAYLSRESAAQCGPCLNGLPRIAGALIDIARSSASPRTVEDVRRWCGLVERRGACAHPDGTVRLVRSAFTTFADEVDRHLRGRCSATSSAPVLPVPGGRL